MLGPNRGQHVNASATFNPTINIVEKGKDMELTEDDVLHILKLIDESKFDYFRWKSASSRSILARGSHSTCFDGP
jgi:hypothetical protein